ncbi:OstA-like protein [Fulvivirga lutea]|uniref:Organic solvent tolerance protein OstA n=1 Tax=Fulvivirga lutea TaxID=2810512 RepID=A0A975A2K8_9BACT|nr:OstA-like protein [Fulvivirga lutea]QSE98951.1 Organic solvent tolerance protein OstA [Fulvivirga lutea]
MIKLVIKYSFILLAICLASVTQAQKKVKLKKADKLIGGVDKSGKRFDRFVGNVVFEQNETTIYCDSAILYKKENIVNAFGHVRITEGDSVTITSKRLTYTGDNKMAKLREDVVFKKLKSVTLYTDFLDYDRIRQQARYYNGGKLVDSANVLTSEKGYYQVNTNMASFKKNVVGKNPDYTLESDTLQYHTKTNIVYFRDHTVLTDVEGNVFEYEEGEYNTNIRKSNLAKGEVETETYTLTGNQLFLDDIRKLYRAVGEVEMISKEQDVIITGENSIYYRDKGIAKVYGKALMKKIMDLDTLFLTADTLVAIESKDPAKKRLLAYKNVQIYKSDLQGIADSLAYVTADSMLFFYDDPVLWTEGNQMTADSINVVIANNSIDRLNMDQNSFVVSTDSIDNFNQIKGREMVAFFNSGKIKKVDVTGNGESLFFALNDEETALVGMNKIFCSSMTINFKLNKADNISFYVNPDASFIPPHELKAPETRLKGFNWRIEQRPVKEEIYALDHTRNKEEVDNTPPVTKPTNVEIPGEVQMKSAPISREPKKTPIKKDN